VALLLVFLCPMYNHIKSSNDLDFKGTTAIAFSWSCCIQRIHNQLVVVQPNTTIGVDVYN